MAYNIRTFYSGPAGVEASIPDWFKTRTEALVAQLGDDSPDVQCFKRMLAEGRIVEEMLPEVDQLAGSTQNPEVLLLAVDIATHAFAVSQLVAQMVPLRPKAA